MRRLTLVFLIAVLCLCLFGCKSSHEMTPEEKAKVDSLRSEISSLEQNISDTQKELGKYSGGLVVSLLSTRIAQDELTISMGIPGTHYLTMKIS